ncbi:MAG: outer membrane protein assembly factor BamD [Candidatus Omnitrophota bacterium]|nr:outer membrane protein assembly factor BamD [Candidatus Omnitrophota bacterium]
MKKINYITLSVMGLVIIFSAQELYAAGFARAGYDAAVRHIKKNQPDFALLEFRNVIRDFPKSPLAQKSMFAIAEYYYDNKMYYDAVRGFTGYIKNYPDSKANVFARAYLLKITEEIKDPTWEEKKMFDSIKQDLFSEPLFLLFREYKETSYKSSFQNVFKIRYYIDNIEVYRNDKLFIKISQ